ncbi:MAG: bifunctional N-acetylglucosamine-1-phosphate uridyltransferase/glucosamine-1-phosphate acetyltransferase [Deltaproteobacteria bacterium]|jgi:bifunctional UDP-N-acetylglucosamine pyrophosphorylase/glucosamine-1-phosphate N-acetyltransferase|nr:bifunctional N-acetylglucosamine-1-phosphate uridyltransferase/glucosamine-1-phosphate acetyltransferase [Deltaproteobacteria bacterium]
MTTNSSISALILAAGLGTRMKSAKAKVLHEVLFKPMILHVLDTVRSLNPDHTFVIVGHQREKVAELVAGYRAACVIQEEQLGTGHAVLCAEKELESIGGTVLILSGDVPLIKADSLRAMLATHAEKKPALTLMTATLADPTNYGRIMRDREGKLLEIVEEKDASGEQRKISEVNAGIYCAETPFLFNTLKKVGSDNKQGEIYLTDIVKIAIDMGLPVDIFSGTGGEELLGINSRSELAAATKYLQHHKNSQLMADGVSLIDPETIFIQQEVMIDKDTVINANVQISGNTIIGRNCSIGPDVVLHDSRIGDNVTIEPFTNLTSCSVPNNMIISPHTRLKKN